MPHVLSYEKILGPTFRFEYITWSHCRYQESKKEPRRWEKRSSRKQSNRIQLLLHGEMGKVGWEDLLEGKLYKKKVEEINNHMDVCKSYKESYYFTFTYIFNV